MERKRNRYASIAVPHQAKKKFKQFATRRRIPLAQAADVAASALEMLTSEQASALIERKPEMTPSV